MAVNHRTLLAGIRTFPQFVAYLRDEMGWPLDRADFEEITFEYTPEELGLDPASAAKIEEIKRLRPLSANQPWGVFFVKFEKKRLPVVALRRILGRVALKTRASANPDDRAAWAADDLLFISGYGDEHDRRICLGRFNQGRAVGNLPALEVIGWDGADTALHLDDVADKLSGHLAWPHDENDTDAWRRQWAAAFSLRHREVITTSKALAERLAELARSLRARILAALAVESDTGVLRKLMKAFQKALLHDLDERGFADMYAQTVSYGLLSARVCRSSGALVADDAALILPETNPFLKELMETFLQLGSRSAPVGGFSLDFDELGVNEVVETLRVANMEAVLRDFGDRNPEEDPVIHFYELFLQQYDNQQRMQRGVFYTPRPVVSYIVRSVHELLKTDFGLEDGLADTASWGEMVARHPGMRIPEGVNPAQDFVQILDPATGTGTFLVEVIGLVHNTLCEKWRAAGLSDSQIADEWNSYVPKHLLTRLHGYELLMAPYAIAHLKISLKLYETGYRFQNNERVRVFLTNALEPPSDGQHEFDFMPALANEVVVVNRMKETMRYTAVLGNPPYSNYGMANKIPWISTLLRDYKVGLQEKKVNLDDDFLKFIRLTQHHISKTGTGIIGLISNNTFLDGVTHRQMRKYSCSVFDTILLLDLHGNSLKRERSPDGSIDENVFNIQQGVSISLWVKRSEDRNHGSIRFSELFGTRSHKLRFLMCHSIADTPLFLQAPNEPYCFFAPKDLHTGSEYKKWASVGEIFFVHGSGIQTDRDELFFDISKESLAKRMVTLFSEGQRSPSFIAKYNIANSSSYNLLDRLRRHQYSAGAVRACLYRPFDMRFVYYADGFTSRPAYDVMRHLEKPGNVSLVLVRQYEYNTPSPCYFFVADSLVERRVFISNRGCAEVFPLHNTDGVEFSCNLDVKSLFFSRLKALLSSSECVHSHLAESAFHYMYAVFFSTIYRERYAGFLKIEYPRIPLPKDARLFVALVRIGAELVGIHLLKSALLDEIVTEYVGPESPEIDRVGWSDDTVWLDAPVSRKGQPTRPGRVGFKGVSEAVWNFHVGGYQVCEKWLKDRKGRRLSAEDIAHYQRIVVALSETIRIMGEIDAVIEEHGGWPGAFQTGPHD